MGWEPAVVSDYPARVELPSGIVSWQLPGWYAALGFNRTQAADKLYFTPIFVTRETTFDRVGLDVDLAAVGGSVLRMGLYAANQDTLLPAALLNDFGTVVADSAGDKLITISLTLQRGYYWAVHISDGAPRLECINDGTSATVAPIQGWEPSTSVNVPDTMLRGASGQAGIATGGLADPAPVTTSSEDPTFAAVRFRVSP